MQRPGQYRTALLTGLCLAIGGLSGGCAKDPTEPAPVDHSPVYVRPTSEDLAMINFRTAYAGLDASGYLDGCLDGAYSFAFDPECLQIPTELWDHAAETAATTDLFTGADGYDALNAEPMPGVVGIEVRRLLRLSAWEDVSASGPFHPGSRRARYEVDLAFRLDGGQGSLYVNGEQVFHVCASEETVDGAPVTIWRVCGQQDLTATDKSVGRMSWGDVKVYYR